MNWNQLSPQQQQMLMYLMNAMGMGGSAAPGGAGPAASTGAPSPAQGQGMMSQGMMNPAQQQMSNLLSSQNQSPLTNQAQQQPSPGLLQYLMGLTGQRGGGAQSSPWAAPQSAGVMGQ